MMRKSLINRLMMASGLALILLQPSGAVAADSDPSVVVSIKPLHSLVAQVMGDTGQPTLLLDGNASPHTYTMRPSQARSLADADLVFWIGHELETFLEKPLETIASKAAQHAMMDATGVAARPFREGHDHHDEDGDHDDHAKGEEHKDHDDHHDHEKHAKKDDHGHDDHGHDDHKDHDDHDKHAEKDEHGHDDDKEHGDHDGHNHAEGSLDPHIWLDPVNAKHMVDAIAKALSEQNPSKAEVYKANAAKAVDMLDELTKEVASKLEPVHEKRFVVFHDAYQYFEDRFDLKSAGAITLHPDRSPGAEQLSEVRHTIEELGATCVFAEPQFEPKLVTTVVEGTPARSGTLDPLGATITEGPALYGTLIRNMAKSIRDCLSGNS
ncbi:zinc ABC transporter substrate-binding protein [Coralliovum pocilloporae]|uniref:zinc ABC transporter substrate-binding protein n=1 Tax=Coralliovum pocilloporae TaxID=3066369 RepID=UPI00330708AA